MSYINFSGIPSFEYFFSIYSILDNEFRDGSVLDETLSVSFLVYEFVMPSPILILLKKGK